MLALPSLTLPTSLDFSGILASPLWSDRSIVGRRRDWEEGLMGLGQAGRALQEAACP